MFERWINFTRVTGSQKTPEIEGIINVANIAEFQVSNGVTLIRELGTPAGKPQFTIAAKEPPSHFIAGAPILPGMNADGKTGFSEADIKRAEAAAFEAGKKEALIDAQDKAVAADATTSAGAALGASQQVVAAKEDGNTDNAAQPEKATAEPSDKPDAAATIKKTDAAPSTAKAGTGKSTNKAKQPA